MDKPYFGVLKQCFNPLQASALSDTHEALIRGEEILLLVTIWLHTTQKMSTQHGYIIREGERLVQ